MTSNQKRLLLVAANHHQADHLSTSNSQNLQDLENADNQLSVDDDFDLYWQEEARNPHRNRIRIGRQYQATVPTLLKHGEKDNRKLIELETLSFCPKRSSKLSDYELDHYFTVAKSLNIFASLVETRSLLGRDVTIADLNRIRNKEGLSLASVIQPNRHSTNYVASSSSSTNIGNNVVSPTQLQQSLIPIPGSVQTNQTSQQQTCINQNISNTECNTTNTKNKSTSDQPDNSIKNHEHEASTTNSKQSNSQINDNKITQVNQPLMRALSHFISLHHPCRHDTDCKKINREPPVDDNSIAPVLRQATISSTASSASKQIDMKVRASRSSSRAIQALANEASSTDENADQTDTPINDPDLQVNSNIDDWTREEVQLFSKAIEVCGKNFGSIKKDFLPSKSVRSIVDYYYIGFKESTDSRKKNVQLVENPLDGCCSPEKYPSNNNGRNNGGGNGGGLSYGSNRPKESDAFDIGSSSTQTKTTSPTASSTSKNPNARGNKSEITESDTVPNILANLQNLSADSTLTNQRQANIKQEGTTVTSNSPTCDIDYNIDNRMSVYNFDDDNNKDDAISNVSSMRTGSEVRPLKAKPLLPCASVDGDKSNANVGSLKFFMDGQLVLKLNACQDQQEGNEKCHWVQSGEKSSGSSSRHKKYSKRSTLEDCKASGNLANGNNINMYNNDDEQFRQDVSVDEDSRDSYESSSSASQIQSNKLPTATNHMSLNNSNSNFMNNVSYNNNIDINQANNPIRSHKKAKFKSSPQPQPRQQIQNPVNCSSEVDQFKDSSGNSHFMPINNTSEASLPSPSPMMNQAMPWLHANSIAMAAAFLHGLPGFPNPNIIPPNFPRLDGIAPQNINYNQVLTGSNPVTSKPMDLSVENSNNSSPKASHKSNSRDRSRNRQVPRNV